MKLSKKFIAIFCSLALVLSSVTFSYSDSNAVTYDSLTYTTLSSDLSYSQLSDGIEGMSADSPALLDNGATLQFAFSADNSNVTLFLNGSSVTTSDDRVTEIGNSIVKLNPQNFDDNSYTLITISSTKGTSEYVVKKGNPTSGEEYTTSGSSSTEETTASSEATTTTSEVTTDDSASTTLPKKLLGLTATNESGTDTIDNAVMFAWADAGNVDNVNGYDSSVTSVVLYIYKNRSLMTKISNATNGGVVGGLSAGTYTAQAANVNSAGEGTLSDTVSFTVTGIQLNYTYPEICGGPKMPNGLSYITGNPEVPADNPAQADNKLGVAWAASSQADIPSYDTSVVGYYLYVFDAETGEPYRRVYVDGADTSSIILESVSTGEYLVCLSAVNSSDQESGLAATSFGLSSIVTVSGEKLDNAQSFDYPNQPTLPTGLTILTEGIQYGFTIAWSADADFTGQQLNLFVDGICIKCGINSDGASYYENRLASGTYTVEVRSQYTDNSVESFGLTQTVTITADPDLDTKTPAKLADSSYTAYESKNEENETTAASGSGTDTEENTTAGTISGDDSSTGTGASTGDSSTVSDSSTQNGTSTSATATEQNTISTNNISVEKVKIKKAKKKITSKKISIKFKEVTGATKYEIQISKTKKFKKVLVKKTVTKTSVKLSNKRLKSKKKLFVRIRATKTVNGSTYTGNWSKVKRVKSRK